jgi:hypothetical protein
MASSRSLLMAATICIRAERAPTRQHMLMRMLARGRRWYIYVPVVNISISSCGCFCPHRTSMMTRT